MLLLFSGAFVACDSDDDTLDLADDSALEFQGNNAVIRSEDLSNLRFKDIPGTIVADETTPQGQIFVAGADDLSDWLEVKKESGELQITGKDGLPYSLDLHFHLHPHNIRRIVVEGDNKVHITATPVLDYLEIVTEGASELIIHDMKVRNLVSRREGKSRMFLSSNLVDFDRTTYPFPVSAVQVLDEHHIVYRDNDFDYLLYAPQITHRNDSVFAVGNAANPLRSHFITHTHELRNEGESYLDALELPTLSVSSRNEGKSRSKVWAIGQLQVKGEGESRMYYLGNPTIDQQLEGDAKLIRL